MVQEGMACLLCVEESKAPTPPPEGTRTKLGSTASSSFYMSLDDFDALVIQQEGSRFGYSTGVREGPPPRHEPVTLLSDGTVEGRLHNAGFSNFE